MVNLQNQGLKYDPPLLWIDDADRQAKWYQALKREWAASRARGPRLRQSGRARDAALAELGPRTPRPLLLVAPEHLGDIILAHADRELVGATGSEPRSGVTALVQSAAHSVSGRLVRAQPIRLSKARR